MQVIFLWIRITPFSIPGGETLKMHCCKSSTLFTHTEQDMSLSSYPDDVANAKNSEVVDDLQEHVANEDVLFDMWLADMGMAQAVDNR